MQACSQPLWTLKYPKLKKSFKGRNANKRLTKRKQTEEGQTEGQTKELTMTILNKNVTLHDITVIGNIHCRLMFKTAAIFAAHCTMGHKTRFWEIFL